MSPYDHIAEAREASFNQTGQYLSDAEINAFKLKAVELGPAEIGVCNICGTYNSPLNSVCNCANKTLVPLQLSSSNSGGDTDYYRIPSDATMLQDLIEFKSMSWNQANIFKAAYRLGDPQTHSSIERDLNKIIWFANRMLTQLQKESNGHL